MTWQLVGDIAFLLAALTVLVGGGVLGKAHLVARRLRREGDVVTTSETSSTESEEPS